MISAQQVYSRLVNPGDSLNVFGRNRLKRPATFAFFLSSFIWGCTVHLWPSSWRPIRPSAGMHSCSTWSWTLVIRSIALGENLGLGGGGNPWDRRMFNSHDFDGVVVELRSTSNRLWTCQGRTVLLLWKEILLKRWIHNQGQNRLRQSIDLLGGH